MHFLKKLLACLLLTVTAHGQLDKDKPAKPKPPAEAILGVWHGGTPAGDEFITFTADGRAIIQRGPAESMVMNYKVDASALPWKLDMSGRVKELDVTVFTIFDFPEPNQFRMAAPAIDQAKRPEAAALKDAKVRMKRITLGAHAGIYQVVEAHLKKLAGTWEGKDGGETVTLTFAADGAFTMKAGDFTDKGRFRIDVSKVPCAMDLLSSEGSGVKYSIYEITTEGQLRVGKAAKNPEDRQAAFDDISARSFKRKETAPAPK
jgi:hypothetical protein